MQTKQKPASKIPVQAKNTSMGAHNICTTKMTCSYFLNMVGKGNSPFYF